MKRILFGIAAVAALLGTPVLAADMPLKMPVAAPPAFTWTGFYAGLNAGVGWNDPTGDIFCVTPPPASVPSGAGCSAPINGTLKPFGGLFGGQAGFNMQTGMFVWGIETDLQWSGINDSVHKAVACCLPAAAPGQGDATTSQSLDWFGTVRGRLGVAVWDRGLLYGTGGLIYGHESVSEGANFNVVGLVFGPTTLSSTRTGWTAGVGFEYALLNNITAKLEGLFYDMGSQTLVALNPTNAFTENGTFNYKGGLVRAGLNVKF
jgi:outer membrane immunogenic protein